MLVNKVKNKTKNKFLYSVLSVVMLSIVGISTVSINKTYAAEVYPTITNTHQVTSQTNNNGFSLWEVFSNIITFIKEWIEKNNSKYTQENQNIHKVNFDILWDTNKLLSNSSLDTIVFKWDYNFSDIVKDKDRDYINYLSTNNIISKNSEKFHPNNFIRLHEFTKLLVNSYRYKLWYNVEKSRWLSTQNYFNKTMPKYYNTAYEMWLLDWVEDIENFERFISYSDVEQILSNFYWKYPELVNSEYINNLDINDSDQTLKRWEMCRVTVKALGLDKDIYQDESSTVFSDTRFHKYWEAIEKLAKLELVNTDNSKFYPDNRITRWEFTDMLVKSYNKSNNLELAISNFNFNIDDLDYNSKYAPVIAYAQEKWLTNFFFETRRWKTYFEMNKAVTKHEAYYIISQDAWVQISYDVDQADKEYITRWEVAQLIVDSFDLDLNNIYKNWSNSQLETFVENIKSLSKTKKLLSFLF